MSDDRSSMRIVVALASLFLLAAACGGSDEPSATPTLAPTPTPSQEPGATLSPVTTPTPEPTVTATPSASCTPTTYTVEAGDLLSVLADSFDIPLDDLIEANDITDPDLIQVGQELVIPCPEA
jgi:LysM repeat protein